MATYKDLVAQRKVLNKQIEQARKAELTVGTAKVLELVSQYELTARDVFPESVRISRKKSVLVIQKCRGPQTGATWSGRGRPPLWMAGKERGAFAIQTGAGF